MQRDMSATESWNSRVGELHHTSMPYTQPSAFDRDTSSAASVPPPLSEFPSEYTISRCAVGEQRASHRIQPQFQFQQRRQPKVQARPYCHGWKWIRTALQSTLAFRLESYLVVTLSRGRSYRTRVGIIEFMRWGMFCWIRRHTCEDV